MVSVYDKVILFCRNFLGACISTLTLSPIYTHSNTVKKKASGKHCGKR